MFVVPKTLLLYWSDYCSAVIDVEAMIAAHINENPAVRSVNIELQRVLNHGVQSEWTHRHIGEVTARLSAGCVGNNRYFANVAVKQKLDRTDADLACSPKIPDPPRWRFWAPRGEERVSGELTPFASATLSESDLVLIDAPISMNLEKADHDVCLCDAPPFARRTDDAQLRLMLSGTARRQLAEYLPGADWLPFCRTLGIVRDRSRGQALEVLQISARIPLLPEAGWAARLIEEADKMHFRRAYYSDENVFLNSWIAAYRMVAADERAKHSYLSGAALAEACGPDLASAMFRFGDSSLRFYLDIENSPYQSAESFWTSLATIL